jgi:two-component system OmpR family response regulator
MAPLILIVEDAPSIREPLARYLETNHFRVRTAGNAAEADSLLAAHAFDLVIADIMMPGEDGLSLCRRIRSSGALPVILLTARAEEVDRILGLEVGADDYVVKPFSPRELLARVKAVLRRSQSLPPRSAEPQAKGYVFGPWTLKTGERTLEGPDGVVTPLSSGEYTLLLTFLERPNLVLNRDQLLDLTRGREAGPFDRSVDNQVSRLRRKIEADPKDPLFIKTVWGGGYRFSTDVRAL